MHDFYLVQVPLKKILHGSFGEGSKIKISGLSCLMMHLKE